MPEDDVESKSFTVISIDSLLVYENKYYLQVYLDDSVYKTYKQTNDRLSWCESFWRLDILYAVLR